MYKIVILGCENSHADSFINAIREDEKYNDIEVIGVYSDDVEATNKLCEKFDLYAMKSSDEFVGQVDGVMVTARHGDNHYKYAKPYIKSGVPMFIDKPVTISEDEAVEMMKEFKENNIRFSGGSMLCFADMIQELKGKVESGELGDVVGGLFAAPINLENEYGGFFFYSQHLVTMVMTVFGYYPKSVMAIRNGNDINVSFRYDDFVITGNYVTGYLTEYYAMVNGRNAFAGGRFNLQGIAKREFAAYYDVLTGKESRESHEEFIAPVFVLNAINRSLESGKEEKVNTFNLN